MLLAFEFQPAAELFLQQTIIGLTYGSLIALIALGYTMVYGIIGLINFAHGDLFMLGTMLALTVLMSLGLQAGEATTGGVVLGFALVLLAAPVFCGALNVGVDYVIYRPLRNAPKLAPLVSAIGVSFVFMNIGMFWSGTLDWTFSGNFSSGASDRSFPDLMPNTNLLAFLESAGWEIRFTWKDLMVIGVTVPCMVVLTYFVRCTKLGKAMRATEQDPLAARLMGIHVDRVIAATFAIGGALAGVASVIYALYINTVSYQMGFQNGLYAFTAAVLGGIGNIPGAVVGAIIIGLVRSLGSAYIGEVWTSGLIFLILIVILIFRPEGLLGKPAVVKV